MSSEFSVKRKKRAKRKQILPWWALLLIIVVAVVLLVMLNPGEEDLTEGLAEKPADEVTLRYINNLLQNDPDNLSLRLQRIQQQIGLNRLDNAARGLEAIKPGKKGSKRYVEVMWLRHQLFYAQQVEKIKKQLLANGQQEIKEIVFPPEVKKTLLKQIDQLLTEKLSMYKLAILAHQALGLEEPAVAKKIHQRMLKLEPTKSPRKLAYYGKIAVYAGDYQMAAHYYFEAQRYDKSIEDKRRYFIAALQALQQSEQSDEVMDVISQHIGNLVNDRDTVIYVTRLALAFGETQMASDYVQSIIYKKDKK